MAETSFENKTTILSEVWFNYRDELEFEDFIEYNDLGLPLSYASSSGLATINESAKNLIAETWELFLQHVGVVEDTGFDSLDDILYDYMPSLVEDEDEEDLLEEEDTTSSESYELGFKDGAGAEQKRVQEVISMHKRWAKEKNRASEYMFWDSAGEVLTPIGFEYDEEAYKEQLEKDGF